MMKHISEFLPKKLEVKSDPVITIDQEYTTSSRITKHYNLLVGDYEVEVEKWWNDDDYNVDQDYEILGEPEVREKLTEEQFDALVDFISELK